MLKKIFNKANADKPIKETPDKPATDIEEPKNLNQDAANEKPADEMPATELESGINDLSESAEELAPDDVTNADAETDSEMEALSKELSELQDKYLRLAAEFDNYRKRTLREKTELIHTAGESLLNDILPLVDDFDRGLELASKAEDMDAVRTGMDLIYNKLKDFLTNHGVMEIQAINEPFDTDWHEAVTNIPAPSDDMKGKIVDVIQKGYMLNHKVMRYSKVVVGD